MNWKNAGRVATAAAFGACVVMSAGACAVAGVAAGGITAYAKSNNGKGGRCLNCSSFRNGFAVNTALALGGAGLGGALGKVYSAARPFAYARGNATLGRGAWNKLRFGSYHSGRRVAVGYHPSYYIANTGLGAVGYAAGQ